MISFQEFMSSQKNPVRLNEEVIIDEGSTGDHNKIENKKLVTEDIHIKEDITEKTEELIGYKIFRDKAENFVCDMEISGANPSNSKARIIIEAKDLTYMFEGTIDATGKCKIPLKKMGFLSENERGMIKLEVIADDTVFTPWEDNFIAVNSKKVEIKILESQEDNTPKVGVRLRNIG